MKRFAMMEIDEAYAHADAGGQALHLHDIIPDPDNAPSCFVRAVARGEWIAHLFDQNTERLKATARRLGVNIIFVDGYGTPRQHIDLCGRPLQRAMMECKRTEAVDTIE